MAVSILEDELGYEIDRIVFASGTGFGKLLLQVILIACESWPSYAEADDVMLNGDLFMVEKLK